MHNEVEDILSDSLESFYDYTPITFAEAGSLFSYDCSEHIQVPAQVKADQLAQSSSSLPRTLTLNTPDTSPANWTLHASSIWRSSIYVADHLKDLHLDDHIRDASREGRNLYVLELGAGAGLPSILIARCYDGIRVVASDYPDVNLIHTLKDNIERNSLSHRCRAIPYGWGSDPSSLFSWQTSEVKPSCSPSLGFDVVLAADTLWNPDLHSIFLESLMSTLRKSEQARIYIAAGLHTGRYTIQAFLNLIPRSGLIIEEVRERAVLEDRERPWRVERAEGEDEAERRRWVIWIVLKWVSV